MIDYVKKDDILEHFCEYCDSHVVGCDECPIKAAIAEIPVVKIDEIALKEALGIKSPSKLLHEYWYGERKGGKDDAID